MPLNPFIQKYFQPNREPVFSWECDGQLLLPDGGCQHGLSDTETLNQADRLTVVNGKSFPHCISTPGCWTFYTPQASGITTWNNNGAASYHGLSVTLRKPLSKGVSFDFNYTLSHSIDRGGGAESGAGSYGGVMLDPYSNTALSRLLGFRCPAQYQCECALRTSIRERKDVLGQRWPRSG